MESILEGLRLIMILNSSTLNIKSIFFDKEKIKSSPVSCNREAALKLWLLSLNLTGVDDFVQLISAV